MAFRSSPPKRGRALTFVAAAVAVAGVVNCATYPSGRDGMLSGTLSSSSMRSASLTHASLVEIMSSAPGTYIDRILADRDSTIERWSDHGANHPLRIWIDSSATIGGSQGGFPAAVRDAFAEWATTGIPLRFAYVTSGRDADVRVKWTDHLDHKTGSTTWRTDRNGWLIGGDITLATHISDGHSLDGRGMRAIALHEVGHALGMSHSIDSHDIMAPLVRVDGLSVPDRNTVKLLYTLPAGHIR
jgi:predicted Zn-dependent protease